MILDHFLSSQTTEGLSPQMSLTSQEHVELPHLRLEVDGCTEEMESRRVLLHGQVDKAQIIQNLPIEGSQVVGSLQAADSLRGRGALDEWLGQAWQPQELHV